MFYDSKPRVNGFTQTENILISELADMIAYRIESRTADEAISMLDFEIHVREEVNLLVQVLDNLMDGVKNNG
jgi:hypothetical protein